MQLNTSYILTHIIPTTTIRKVTIISIIWSMNREVK